MSLLKSEAQTIADRGLQAIDAATHQVSRGARHASDRTVAYIHAEPIKATLIAAAAGALLAGVVCLLARPPGRR